MGLNMKLKIYLYTFLIVLLVLIPFGSTAGESFSITEINTDYGIVENTITLEITDLIDKDQYITNISEIFADHELTDEIEIKEVLLNQSYDADVYGYLNESQGKYTTFETVEECIDLNETNQTCVNVNYYYDNNETLMDCDYVLEDKSCLKTIYGKTGTEVKTGFLNLPTNKEKIVIDGLKIEQKQDGLSIPLPKGGTVRVKIRYSHHLAYNLEVLPEINKYDISIITSDGIVILDPNWFNSDWGARKYRDYTSTSGDLSNYQVRFDLNTTPLYEAGNLRSDCGDIRFADSNGVEFNYWLDNDNCVIDDDSANSTFWVNVTSLSNNVAKRVYVYYNNPEATHDNAVGGADTFILFNDGSTFDGSTAVARSGYSPPSWSIDNNAWKATGSSSKRVGYRYLNSPTGVNSYILEAYMKPSSLDDAHNIQHGFKIDTSVSDATSLYFRWLESASQFGIYNSVGGYVRSTASDVMTLDFMPWKLVKDGDDRHLYWNDVLRISDSETYNAQYVATYYYDNGYNFAVWYKNMRVRQFTSPEPTISSIGEEEFSAVPHIKSYAISPAIVYTNTDFKFNMTATDNDNTTFTGYVQFYINGTISGTEQSEVINNNTNTLIGTLSSSNFYPGSTLIAEYRAGDGIYSTLKANSSEVTVGVKDWFNINYNRRRNITYVPDVNLTLNVNGTSGFYGQALSVNPKYCQGNLSIYYKDADHTDYKIVCNNTIEAELGIDGTVSYWKFDNETTSGTTSYDSVGSNNGVIDGATTGVDGNIGEAYDFDGISNNVNIDSNANLMPTTFTSTQWVYAHNPTASYEAIVDKFTTSGTPYQGWYLRIAETTGNLWLAIADTNGDHNIWDSGLDIAQNEWVFVAATYDYPTKTRVVYVNGESSSDVMDNSFNPDAAPLRYGEMARDNSYQFDGLIDEPKIWNIALTENEINVLYDNAKVGFNNTLLDEEEEPIIPPSNTCNPTSPLTADYVFDCNDNCTQTTILNANGYSITWNGAGNYYLESDITNIQSLISAYACNFVGSGDIIGMYN